MITEIPCKYPTITLTELLPSLKPNFTVLQSTIDGITKSQEIVKINKKL